MPCPLAALELRMGWWGWGMDHTGAGPVEGAGSLQITQHPRIVASLKT